MSHVLVTAVAIVVVALCVQQWDNRRGSDPEQRAEEETNARRVLGFIALTVMVLAVALVPQALGVPAAGWLALAALLVLMPLVYLGPWLRVPRRKPKP